MEMVVTKDLHIKSNDTSPSSSESVVGCTIAVSMQVVSHECLSKNGVIITFRDR